MMALAKKQSAGTSLFCVFFFLFLKMFVILYDDSIRNVCMYDVYICSKSETVNKQYKLSRSFGQQHTYIYLMR